MTEKKLSTLDEAELRRETWKKYRRNLRDKTSSKIWLGILILICILTWSLVIYLVITFPLIWIAYILAWYEPILFLIIMLIVHYFLNKILWFDQERVKFYSVCLVLLMVSCIIGFLIIWNWCGYSYIDSLTSAVAIDMGFLFAILGAFLFHRRFKGAGILYLHAKQLLNILVC